MIIHFQIIDINGGTPPTTFEMFSFVVNSIGDPPRPLGLINLDDVNFGTIPNTVYKTLDSFGGI